MRVVLVNGLMVLAGGVFWGVADYLQVKHAMRLSLNGEKALICLALLIVVLVNWRLFREKHWAKRLLATTAAALIAMIATFGLIFWVWNPVSLVDWRKSLIEEPDLTRHL